MSREGFKILFKLPLRQTAGMVASLLKLAGLDWPVPDFSTLCRRQKTLAVQVPYRRADGPLNLRVDSTGIKFLGDGEWQARKHGVQGRRQWRKVHLAMDPATSDIRAVEFTPSRDGDSPVLPDLLSQIPKSELIGTVTADGAYDTRRCHTAIIEREAVPIIPIRKNGRPWKEDGPAAAARNDIPGISWGLASVLPNSGVRYMVAALPDYYTWHGLKVHPYWNEDEVLSEETKGGFWWQGPDASKLLFWFPGPRFVMWTGAQIERELPAHLDASASKGYAHDMIHCEFSGGWRDNSPPDLRVSIIAREWNDQ